MQKNKTLFIGLAVIVVCLAAVFVGMLTNRSTSREATAQELETYGQYDIGWKLDDFLEVCTYREDTKIGNNSYRVYDSDKLPEILRGCRQIERIAQDSSGILYIQYTDGEQRNVTLAYADEGLVEMGVYDPQTDTFFHNVRGEIAVWEKFRSGVQWGGK